MKLRTSRWILAVCIAAIIHIALFWGVALINYVLEPSGDWTEEKAKIEYVQVERVEEQMTLFDPRPLLLPTNWNFASIGPLDDLKIFEDEEPIFEDYDPMFAAEDGNFVFRYGNPWSIRDDSRESLSSFEVNRFAQLRQKERARSEHGELGLHVSLKDPISGRVLHSESSSLYNNAALEISRQWPSWSPVTFLVTVLDSFLLSQISIVESSGFDDVDKKLGDLIAHGLLSGAQAPDGVYFVEIGP